MGTNVTRKVFLLSLISGTAAALLEGCGGGGGYGSGAASPSPQPADSCGASGNEISGNHGHVLALDATDLDSTTAKTFRFVGTADHTHEVTLTPAMFAQLKAGTAVVVTSTTTLGHQHDVTISCL